MTMTPKLTTRAALGLMTATALLVLGGQAAYAARSTSAGVVATRLGSQDPRDTAQATGWAGAVRPDGAALRATFDDLAARAARTRAESDHASATASTASTAAGFSWRDAGIGGAVTLLAVVLAGFALATVSHRAKTPARI